jgi:integrase
MAYVDKRDGKPTGSFVGEWTKGKKKRRFKTLQDAKDYETFCKLMGREPPTIDEGISEGGPTFAQVAEQCKAAGGPKGKWKAERDCSVIQRVDYCVVEVGAYPIGYVHDHAQELADKIVASLDRAVGPGKKHRLSNATKNRYVNSGYGAVLTYAYKKRLIPSRPPLDLLDEVTSRKERDALNLGQDEVIVRLMREAGHTVEATCVEALIETGLRSGELRNLAPEQVTIEQVMDEDGTLVPVGAIALRKGQTKNNGSRLVAFTPEVAREIKAIVAAGKMPTKDRLLDSFKLAVKSAGYTGNLVIHSLRHTRVTRMRKSGITEEIRMKLVGHTGKTVHRGYDHVDLEDQLQVMKKVQDYAGKRGPQAAVIEFCKTKSVG